MDNVLLEIQAVYCRKPKYEFHLITKNAYKNIKYIIGNSYPKKINIVLEITEIIDRSEYIEDYKIFNRKGVFSDDLLDDVRDHSFDLLKCNKDSRSYCKNISDKLRDVDLLVYFDIFDQLADTDSGPAKYCDQDETIKFIDSLPKSEEETDS